MLKKLKRFAWAFALLIVLTACSGGGTTNLTNAEEVLQQSLTAMEGLDSYSMKMESDQTMTINNSETVNMKIDIDADMTLEPLAFHQKMTMETDDEMMGTFDTEMYLVNDTIYMFDPTVNEWMELPMEFNDQIGGLSEMQMSPDQQLMMLKNFVDDIELSEVGDEYVLKLTGEGTEFLKLVQEFGGGAGIEDFEAMMEMFSQLDLNKIDYEIFINKETLYQTKLNMMIDMTMGMDGETIHTVQNMKATIDGYNEVGEIVLPDGL